MHQQPYCTTAVIPCYSLTLDWSTMWIPWYINMVQYHSTHSVQQRPLIWAASLWNLHLSTDNCAALFVVFVLFPLYTKLSLHPSHWDDTSPGTLLTLPIYRSVHCLLSLWWRLKMKDPCFWRSLPLSWAESKKQREIKGERKREGGGKSCHVDLVWLPGMGGGGSIEGRAVLLCENRRPMWGERENTGTQWGWQRHRRKEEQRQREKRVCVCVQVPERENR